MTHLRYRAAIHHRRRVDLGPNIPLRRVGLGPNTRLHCYRGSRRKSLDRTILRPSA
jgi:hypothetical protein